MRPGKNLNEQTEEALSLTDLNPTSVFKKRCESEYAEQDYSELVQTFEEALERMEDKEG